MRRVGELHRLLNSRKGSLKATSKSIQALDAMAKEYVDFEVTMSNVTHEQEAGDTLQVATMEVAEELERTLKVQGRLQDDLDNSSNALTAATKDFSTGSEPEHARAEGHVYDGIGSLGKSDVWRTGPREQRDQVPEGGDGAH